MVSDSTAGLGDDVLGRLLRGDHRVVERGLHRLVAADPLVGGLELLGLVDVLLEEPLELVGDLVEELVDLLLVVAAQRVAELLVVDVERSELHRWSLPWYAIDRTYDEMLPDGAYQSRLTSPTDHELQNEYRHERREVHPPHGRDEAPEQAEIRLDQACRAPGTRRRMIPPFIGNHDIST